MVTVPDLIGQNKKSLSQGYYDLKIEAEGTGDTVIKQQPEPGVKVKSGSKIRIYLGDKNDKGD